MNDSNSPLIKDIEELIKKAAQANKVFINEGSKLVQQFGAAGKKQEMPSVKPELLTDAFNAIVKLNIQHASQLIDLGISFTKKMTGLDDDVVEPVPGDPQEPAKIEPAFVLKTGALPGAVATVEFLLDNIKKEKVVCELAQTDFIHQTDFTINADFKTAFDPQSFPLNPSESKRVLISVELPTNAQQGVYLSNVQVKGFEPAFFSIYLTVL